MQLLLFKGRGLVSRFILWQTRSAYSHAAVLFSNGVVVESVEGAGVRMLHGLHPSYKGVEIDVFDVPGITPEQAFDAYLFAFSQVGKRYDWTMVFRFLTRQQEARKSSGKWFCSELAYVLFGKAGKWLLRHSGTHPVEPWRVSPGLLGDSPLLVFNRTVRVSKYGVIWAVGGDIDHTGPFLYYADE